MAFSLHRQVVQLRRLLKTKKTNILDQERRRQRRPLPVLASLSSSSSSSSSSSGNGANANNGGGGGIDAAAAEKRRLRPGSLLAINRWTIIPSDWFFGFVLYLSSRDVYCGILHTCRTWKEYIQSPTMQGERFWRRVYLETEPWVSPSLRYSQIMAARLNDTRLVAHYFAKTRRKVGGVLSSSLSWRLRVAARRKNLDYSRSTTSGGGGLRNVLAKGHLDYTPASVHLMGSRLLTVGLWTDGPDLISLDYNRRIGNKFPVWSYKNIGGGDCFRHCRFIRPDIVAIAGLTGLDNAAMMNYTTRLYRLKEAQIVHNNGKERTRSLLDMEVVRDYHFQSHLLRADESKLYIKGQDSLLELDMETGIVEREWSPQWLTHFEIDQWTIVMSSHHPNFPVTLFDRRTTTTKKEIKVSDSGGEIPILLDGHRLTTFALNYNIMYLYDLRRGVDTNQHLLKLPSDSKPVAFGSIVVTSSHGPSLISLYNVDRASSQTPVWTESCDHPRDTASLHALDSNYLVFGRAASILPLF